MEIKWTISSALWKCVIPLKRIHRAKKNYHCMGIMSFIITFMILYFWKWRVWNEVIEEFNYLTEDNSQIYSDTGCQFPLIDPFSKVAMKYDRNMTKIVCDGEDWVECNVSECKVTKHILENMKNIECQYKDIIYVNEHNYVIAPAIKMYNDEKYVLNKSDFFKVSCFGYNKNGLGLLSKRWHGYKSGIRPIEPPSPAPGRENSINVLILAFDSTSRNGFIRKMPKSYKYLKQELKAIVLKGYNIVGDGTPDALFPILSGKTELQHPYARQRYSKQIYLDPDLFIFHTAKQDGYQTAYYEDMPWIGSFQYRYNGFRRCPADHYLRSFLMEESKEGTKWWKGIRGRYCIGATPQYLFLLNLTRQIPKSRNCDEAGVLPHWCICLNTKWYNVDQTDPLYKIAADSLSEFINNITDDKRSLCVERKLTSIEWVVRQDSKNRLSTPEHNLSPNIYYQTMIIMSPGRAVFEASMQYNESINKFIISDNDISRISAYGNEPACVSATHPHLNKYCYCKDKLYRVFNLLKFNK